MRHPLIARAILTCGLATCVAAAAVPPPTQWRTLPTEPYPKKRDDIVFLDRGTGFYGTGKGDLFRTDDGGSTWTRVLHSPGTFIRALNFIDRRQGFFGNLGPGFGGDITDAVPLYRTRDGGRTWTPVDLGAATIPGICAIDILHARAIYEGDVRERVVIHAAGRANGPAKLIRSEDGGATWRLIDLSDRAGMILDVKFTAPDVGYVFAATSSDLDASHALILRTTDGGRTWTEAYRSPRLHEMIWKASFADREVAFATIQNDDPANRVQRIVKSVDGGRHWREMRLVDEPAAQEFGVGFVDRLHGWVGTASGGFESRDGGRSWAPSNLAPRANKIRVRAIDGTRMVYAIGSEVQVARQ